MCKKQEVIELYKNAIRNSDRVEILFKSLGIGSDYSRYDLVRDGNFFFFQPRFISSVDDVNHTEFQVIAREDFDFKDPFMRTCDRKAIFASFDQNSAAHTCAQVGLKAIELAASITKRIHGDTRICEPEYYYVEDQSTHYMAIDKFVLALMPSMKPAASIPSHAAFNYLDHMNVKTKENDQVVLHTHRSKVILHLNGALIDTQMRQNDFCAMFEN